MKKPTMLNCQERSCGRMFLSETGMEKFCPACKKNRNKARMERFLKDNPNYMQTYGRLRYQAVKDTRAECRRLVREKHRQLAIEAGFLQMEV